MRRPFLTGLEDRIAQLVIPVLSELGFELVRVAISGHENLTVQIMADRQDDTLLSIDDCEKISHAVEPVIDVMDPITKSWTLEVSSAGIDRPLVRIKDWNRFAGHIAKVETKMPVNGRKRFVGTVVGAVGQKVCLRLEDNTEVNLLLDNLHKARLMLTDALIESSAALATPMQPGVSLEEECNGNSIEKDHLTEKAIIKLC